MIVRHSAIVLSLMLHVGILILTITGLPFVGAREFVIPPAPVIVDYVEISQVTETTKPSTSRSKKKASKKSAPPPMPNKKPKAVAQNTSKQAKAPSKKPGSTVKGKGEGQVEKGVPLPDQTAETKQASAKSGSKDFSSVLKNLIDQEEEETFSDGGFNAPLGEKMTISEQDALRAQLERCWNVPIGARDAENMVIEISMTINPDRTLRDAKIVNGSRYNSDTFYRAVADSAMRAVRSPLCSPFDLPSDKYDVWKRTVVRFNARDMF